MRLLIGKDREEFTGNTPLDSFPEELSKEGIWFQFSVIDDADINVGVVACAYNNKSFKNPYKTSPIVVSNKIDNGFPAIQTIWWSDDNINRIWVDMVDRNKNITVPGILVNNFVAKEIGRDVWSIICDEKQSTRAADQVWNKVYSLGLKKEKVEIDLNDMFQYRTYSHPIMHMEKRLVYVENNS